MPGHPRLVFSCTPREGVDARDKREHDKWDAQMPDLADLFPGFSWHWIDTSIGKMFARVGGKGPPLLALHGYPQTHVMWHRVAPVLAEHFTVVLADLPGYGDRKSTR